jgi:large subunit ribosomal protein L10e
MPHESVAALIPVGAASSVKWGTFVGRLLTEVIMARVPAKMYRKITQRPYTRRKYMGGVPGLRILQFHSGNKTADFPVHINMVPTERGQIRHTALESLRITAVRYMDKKVGRDNYHLHVRVYPHHVLRQNKQASGAGADRVSMGMRLAFGKPIGTAARVDAGQAVLTIHTVARGIEHAKEAMRKCANKIAPPCYIEVGTSDGRTVDEVINIAADAAGTAMAGAGAPTEESEAEDAAKAEAAAEAAEGEEAESADADSGEDSQD